MNCRCRCHQSDKSSCQQVRYSNMLSPSRRLVSEKKKNNEKRFNNWILNTAHAASKFHACFQGLIFPHWAGSVHRWCVLAARDDTEQSAACFQAIRGQNAAKLCCSIFKQTMLGMKKTAALTRLPVAPGRSLPPRPPVKIACRIQATESVQREHSLLHPGVMTFLCLRQTGERWGRARTEHAQKHSQSFVTTLIVCMDHWHTASLLITMISILHRQFLLFFFPPFVPRRHLSGSPKCQFPCQPRPFAILQLSARTGGRPSLILPTPLSRTIREKPWGGRGASRPAFRTRPVVFRSVGYARFHVHLSLSFLASYFNLTPPVCPGKAISRCTVGRIPPADVFGISGKLVH